MVNRRKKNRVITLKTLSVFLILLGAFLFALSTIGYFTGFAIYDPYITGDNLKTASWNYTNPENYSYNGSLSLSNGVVSLLKPSDHVETLTSDFVTTPDMDISGDELKLMLTNGSYLNASYTSGVYDSIIMDTNWNALRWTETLNAQTIIVSYRAGNTADLSSITWSATTNGGALSLDGQYFQYKIDFVTDGLQTSVVTDATLTANYYTSGLLETQEFLPASLTQWNGFYASDSGSGITYAYNNGGEWVSVMSGASLVGLDITKSVRFKVILTGDGSSSPISNGFNVTYNVSSNVAPVLASIGSKDLVSGESFSYDVNANDANNDTLAYSDDTSMFVIDPSTGMINFTPSTEGNYTINISVSDGSLGDSESVVWEVIPASETNDDEETTITTEDDSTTITSDEETTEEEPVEGTGDAVVDVPVEEVPDVTLEETTAPSGLFGGLLTGFAFVTGDADPKVGGAILFSFVLLGLVASHYLFYVKGYWVSEEDSGKITEWIKGVIHREGSKEESATTTIREKKNKNLSTKR